MSEDNLELFGDDTHGNDLSRANVEGLDDRHWPRAMAELVDVFTAAAVREEIAVGDEAQALARWAVLTLGNHFGGRQTYLPKGESLRSAMRDQQIWQEFNGRNQDELARKFDLTVIRVYQILSEQRALHRDKIQPRLL